MKGKWTWFEVTCLVILALSLAGCLRRSAGAAPPAGPTVVPVADEAVDPALSGRLEGPRTVEDGASIPLTFTLTNNTAQTLYLLTWFTPLEGIANEIFIVRHEGTPLAYEGILVMRSDPSPEAYVELAGGATTSVTVDLAEAYDFSQPGDYSIAFLSPRMSDVATGKEAMATTMDELGKVEIPCDPITVTVSPSAAGEVAAPPATPDPSAPPTVILEAVVGWSSPSARIITLETPVDGISTIALLEDTVVWSSEGEKVTLNDLQPGTRIKAIGQQGNSDALLAAEVRVLDIVATPAAPPRPTPSR
ncbi:MAG: hypothetical protein JXC32_19870 [Anaerolineae bacterium]|nr:hypothetical protein [Anaerolineae bacterium]